MASDSSLSLSPLPLLVHLHPRLTLKMESLRQATQNKLTESERIREKLEADNVELYTKLR